MAAPSFVAASNGSGGNTDTSENTFDPNGYVPSAVGNILVFHVLQDGTGADATITTITGNVVEDLAGNNNQLTQIHPSGGFAVGSAAKQLLWIGRALSDSEPIDLEVGITSSSGDDLYKRIYEFSGVNPGTALSDVIENSSAGNAVNGSGTSNTIADTAVVTLGPDRLACNFVAVNDDNALDAFTGQTGGTWAEAVAEFAASAGTDGAVGIQTATIASADTINGGTDTMAASDAWGVVGFALIPVESGPTEHQGSFTMDLSPAISVGATRETATGFALDISPAIAVGAVRETFTGFSMALDPTIAVNAIREAIVGITFPLDLQIATAATRETFGGVTMPLDLGIATNAFKETFAGITFPVDLTISVDATSSTGGTEQFASITFPLSLAISTGAVRETFTGFSQDLAPSIVTAALRETSAGASFDLSPAISVAATRETFTGFSVDLSVDLGVQATRETFTAIANALELAIETAVTKETFGGITFPLDLQITTNAFIEGQQVVRNRSLLGVGK